MNADCDLDHNDHPSVKPLSQKPGAQSQAGMSAPKIEASIQLSFDKKYDRKQPEYWPVVPLKF